MNLVAFGLTVVLYFTFRFALFLYSDAPWPWQKHPEAWSDGVSFSVAHATVLSIAAILILLTEYWFRSPDTP